MDVPDLIELERRLGKVEQQLGQESRVVPRKSTFHPVWPLLTGLSAVVLGHLSVGFPRHYYPYLFSFLLLLLLYHRADLRLEAGAWKWPLALVNFLLLCLLFHCLIGGGIGHPLDWVRLPVVTSVPPPAEKSWYSAMVPAYAVQWQAIPTLAEWSIDITRIQTFLLLAVLAGALFRFEPFTSLAALALLLVSIPSYMRFNWDWVVPFIVAGSVAIYLQAGMAGNRFRGKVIAGSSCDG